VTTSILKSTPARLTGFGGLPPLRRLAAQPLVGSSLAVLLTTVITSGFGYAFWALSARVYPAATVGHASALLAAATTIALMAGQPLVPAVLLGLPTATNGERRLATLTTAGALAAIAAGLLAAAAVVVLPALSGTFATLHQPLVAALFIAVAVTTSAGAVVDAAAIALRRGRVMAVRGGVFASGKLLLLCALMVLLPVQSIAAMLGSWAAFGLVTVIAAFLALRRRLAVEHALRLSRAHLTEALRGLRKGGGAHVMAQLGGLLPAQVLPLVVASRLGAEATAYFSLTWMLATLSFMVSPAVAQALLAEGAYAPERMKQRTRIAAALIVPTLVPLVIAFLAFGRQLLSLFGPGYAQGAALLAVLAVSAYPDAATNLAVTVLRVRGRLRVAAALNLQMAAVAVGVAWVTLPSLGLAGVGWAWVAAQVSGMATLGLVARAERWSDQRAGRRTAIQQLAPGDVDPAPHRLTLRNLAAALRWLVLAIRHRQLRQRRFFIDRGACLEVGPRARVAVGSTLRVMADFTGHFLGEVEIGDNVFFNRGCHVDARLKVSIGDNCLFGEGASIHDADHVFGPGDRRPIAERGFVSAPVTIGRNVWVGAKATITRGVTIGDNAVIAAHAVVTRDVPPNSMVAGLPARVIRQWTDEERPVEG
jgi:acetyltransferase-like isoleucine patch superfamily enzyme/O-antigen/teichoic acid export membrane protein